MHVRDFAISRARRALLLMKMILACVSLFVLPLRKKSKTMSPLWAVSNRYAVDEEQIPEHWILNIGCIVRNQQVDLIYLGN